MRDGQGKGDPLRLPAARRLNILAVDDNRHATDTLAMLPQASGHDVLVAYDGASAIEAAGARRPDVVSSHIGMPGMGGLGGGHLARRRPESDRGARGGDRLKLTSRSPPHSLA